ncbi:hypothetical protein RND71_006666 [Anisodus tanguticus]|uniref:RNase H type-1 domain-containing protein n=1 Tax=Anisodus tanguticus TaxID=243964 RepID=A0AAE1SSD5_9SOLA|nr:hypothetical protein RND71_006666 [Anisodus tanguticus]
MDIPPPKKKNGRKIRLPPRRGEVKATIFMKLLKSVAIGDCFGPKLINPAEALIFKHLKWVVSKTSSSINWGNDWKVVCDQIMGLSLKIECLIVEWTRPPDRWLKINTDGSKNMEGDAGIRGICWDPNGIIMMAFHGSIGKEKTIKETMELIDQGNYIVQHCYRESNQVADALAKWSIGRRKRIISSTNDLPAIAKGSYTLDLQQMAAFRHIHRKNQFM